MVFYELMSRDSKHKDITLIMRKNGRKGRKVRRIYGNSPEKVHEILKNWLALVLSGNCEVQIGYASDGRKKLTATKIEEEQYFLFFVIK